MGFFVDIFFVSNGFIPSSMTSVSVEEHLKISFKAVVRFKDVNAVIRGSGGYLSLKPRGLRLAEGKSHPRVR